MPESRIPDSTADLIHRKSVDILSQVGFCVPEPNALACLQAAGFPVDRESRIVRVTPQLLETALARLPRDVTLYDRAGESPAPFRNRSCFMGAGTPVNVLEHVGVCFPSDRALSTFAEHGAQVDEDSQTVRLSADLVTEALPDIRQRARADFDGILAEHEPEPIERAAQAELRAILAAAEQELNA